MAVDILNIPLKSGPNESKKSRIDWKVKSSLLESLI